MEERARRRFLACLSTAIVGLAGCTRGDAEPTATATSDSGPAPGTTPSPQTARAGSDTPTDSPERDGTTATVTETATEAGSLDLREANVVDVSVSADGDGSARFSVTLHHDDDGEGGYANWWQVETLGGRRLGRRELLHPHSEQPFTRSETIDVPDDVDCVVVRGHDETHEYGGRAMLVTVASGASTAVQQGSEPQSFADATCPGQG